MEYADFTASIGPCCRIGAGRMDSNASFAADQQRARLQAVDRPSTQRRIIGEERIDTEREMRADLGD